MVKAAAVVRGEWVGTPLPGPNEPRTRVRVPAVFAAGLSQPSCFAFRPAQSAGCAPTLRSASGEVTLTTYVGRYPPLYYLLVGLPTLVTTTPGVFYAMRLAGAAAAAVFLAGAFAVATRSRRRLAVPAVALAATPEVLFFGGVVNPSGLEMASAICAWAAGLVLASEPAARRDPAVLGWLAAAVAVFVQARGLSPFYVAILAVVVVFLLGADGVREVLRARAARLGLVVVVAAGAFAGAWLLAVDPLRLVPGSGTPVPPDAGTLEVLDVAVGKYPALARQMVAVFGWKDTVAPLLLYVGYAVTTSLLLLRGLARGSARERVALLALAAATFAVPVLTSASQARTLGVVGQGRYTVPLAVAVPLLGALAGWPNVRRRAGALAGASATAVLLAVVGAAQVDAFLVALRRYRTGVDGPLFARDAPWAPPGGALLLAVAFALVTLAYLGWAWRRSSLAAAARRTR